MIKVDYSTVYNTHDKNNKPSVIVHSGDVVEVKTQLNGGGWLNSMEDHWDPSKSNGPNLSVVIGVEEAKAGDTLKVEILDIIPDKIGYTGFAGWRTPLTREIWPNDWDVVTKTVAIDDKYVYWSDDLKLPLIPMIGTIGTAPAGEPMYNQLAGETGGNMDVQEVTVGTTVYLPCQVDLGLLHIGDGHAIMGDGEINSGGGIECKTTTTIRITVEKGYKANKWIRMENDEYIMAVANTNTMKEGFVGATNELIHWMVEDYGFKAKEAFLLLGQVLEARATQCHGDPEPFVPYIAKIKKKYLIAEKNPSFD